MISLILISLLSTSEPTIGDVKRDGINIANNWCMKQRAELGKTCKVLSVYFSSDGTKYLNKEVAFMTIQGFPAALFLEFRFGTWYIESVLLPFEESP